MLLPSLLRVTLMTTDQVGTMHQLSLSLPKPYFFFSKHSYNLPLLEYERYCTGYLWEYPLLGAIMEISYYASVVLTLQFKEL